MSEPWRSLWAKSDPFHPLWKHLFDAAAVSLALPNPVTRDGWPDEFLAWVVGMHDVGKAHPAFQHMELGKADEYRDKKAKAEREGKSADELRWLRKKLVAAEASDRVLTAGLHWIQDEPLRHEQFSAAFLRFWAEDRKGDDPYAWSMARAIVAHHGHWDCEMRKSPTAYERVQSDLAELLADQLGHPEFPAKPDDLSAFGMRLTGHIVLCDWIASNERFFTDPRLTEIEESSAYFERAKIVAREIVSRLGFLPDGEPGQPEQVVATPRTLQSSLLQANLPPGLVIVEAPMGEGKTEAAWILAEQWRTFGYYGCYMALPTQVTGDAIFERYERDYLRPLGRSDKVHLIHGMAWLREEEEPEEAFVVEGEPEDNEKNFPEQARERMQRDMVAQWFRPTRRAMLAAHGAGTIDQFLLAGLNARFGFLRLYGLDGRVLVVDEVHAYDAYMTAILCRGLQWCAVMKIPVILLSATLSSKQRQQLLEAYGSQRENPEAASVYPLVTHLDFDGAVRTLTPQATTERSLAIEPCYGLLGTAEPTARLAEELAGEDKCVCVIVNTVRQAQAIFNALNLRPEDKALFHARFTAGRRKEIAEKVIAAFGRDGTRPRRYVLVATQVVEQSLDVDFDAMISELAPIDLLLQRSGRLHRHDHGERGTPRLHVLLPKEGDFEFGGTERVYDRYVLLRTLALVATERRVELPRDFRRLVEGVYGEGPTPTGVVNPEDLTTALSEWEKGVMEMETIAQPFLLNSPTPKAFHPVGNSLVGDDSDDGNGWRAKTRLGANDRTCHFVKVRDLERIKRGKLPMPVVRELYRETVRVPHYIRLDEPAEGYLAAVEAEGALRGLLLIPYEDQKQWIGGGQLMRYSDVLGLTTDKA